MLPQLFNHIFLQFVRDWRERYPTTAAIAGEVFGVVLSLLTYWYTSKAFDGGRLGSFLPLSSYFDYIILCEASLSVPIGLMSGGQHIFKDAHSQGIFEFLLSVPRSRLRLMSYLLLPSVLKDLSRGIGLFLLVCLRQESQIDWLSAMLWFILQMVSIPFFFGIGIFLSGVFLKFWRGEGILSVLLALAAVTGGAYFPTTILPEVLQNIAQWVNPIHLFLQSVLSIFSTQPSFPLRVLLFLPLGAVAVCLGIWSVQIGFEAIRERGSAEIIR